MIPDPSSNLGLLADRILTLVLPDLKSEYMMADTAMVGMLLAAMQGEMASGIEHRMTDINGMKVLFGQALGQVDDAKLKSELELSRDLEPESLTMADVNILHDQLTRQLIELHEYVGRKGGCQQLDADIWRYLEENAGRYVLDVPM